MAWEDIASTETAPGALVTSSLMNRIVGNLEYLKEQNAVEAGDVPVFKGSGSAFISTSYVKTAEFLINAKGEFRLKWFITLANIGDSVASKVYKNGSPVGTEFASTATSTNQVFSLSEDISGFLLGDTIQLYCKAISISTPLAPPQSSQFRCFCDTVITPVIPFT